MNQDKFQAESKWDRTYHSLLQRLKSSLYAAEQKTMDALHYDLEQAIELEAAAEEMTREEVHLIAAYLKRDLQDLSNYIRETRKGVAEWLKFDTSLLENRMLELLLEVADRTALEQKAVVRELQARDIEYHAGDYVLTGTFVCDSCTAVYVHVKPTTLINCVECGGDHFRRTSH